MPTSKQRREAERRRLQRQLQRRTQRENRRRRTLTIVSVLGVLAVIALVIGLIVITSSDDKPSANAPKSPTTSPSTSPSSSASPSPSAPSYPCTWTKGGTAAKPATVPTTTRPPRTGTTDVSVRTSQGPMTFRLNRANAPCTVASFLSLAAQHYYDGTSCHRLTSGGLSVLQCGDPKGNGSGGPGYSFKDELTGKERYTRGVLAMANSGPNTNGSQFFIVYKDSQLGPSYTIFGTVSQGLGVVDRVAAKGSNPANDGKPKLPITLQKVVALK
jgi:peptidyl-prolyl cis-trans isomerase B (cyclophilin B)